VKEILGDLSDDIQETLNKVESLLDDHRVEIKSEISNTVMLISASGEISEKKKNIKIQEKKQEDKYVN